MRPRPLAVVVPVLARPHRVIPFLEALTAATPERHRVLFVASPGDTAEVTALEAAGVEALDPHRPADWSYVLFEGNYAAKVNAGARFTDEPLIFTGADDLEFTPGWLPAAAAVMDATDAGVVGTQDECNPRVIAGEHATHFLVARWYVDHHGTADEPGLIFHEGYPHEYVDNELIATAKARRSYAFADASVVRHLHPMNGGAPLDRLYRAAPRRMVAGRRVYASRRHLWADLPPVSSSVLPR